MKQLLTICLIFSSLSSHAFDSEQDSLIKAIKKTSGIQKAEALQELGFIYVKKNIDSATKLNNQALFISKKLKNRKLEVVYLLLKGKILAKKSLGNEAEKTINQALELAKNINDNKSISKSYYHLARFYEDTGDFKLATETALKGIHYAESAKDNETMGNIYECCGRCAYYLAQYNNGLKYFKKAYFYHSKTNNLSNISGVCMNLGIMIYKNGNINESIKYYQKAFESFAKLKDTLNMAKCYENIALSYDKFNLDSAIVFELKAIKLYNTSKNIESEYTSQFNLGSIYISKGDKGKAIKYAFNALKIAEKLKDDLKIGDVYNHIANVYKQFNQNDKAIEYAKKSIEIRLKTNNNAKIANSYITLSSVYFNDGEYNLAIEYGEKALNIFQESKNEYGKADAYLSIGNAYQRKKEPQKALSYFLKTLSIIENTGNNDFIAGMYSNIGVIHYDLKNYAKANEYYLKALAIRKTLGRNEVLAESYETLANLNYDTKNFKVAFDYLKLYISNKNKYDLEKANKTISEMSAKYESEKKNGQIKILREQKKASNQREIDSKNRANLIIIFSLIFLVLSFSIIAIMIKNSRQKQLANKKLAEQNELITIQKNIVEEKNIEILDSISYAKRIQNAILPQQKIVKEYLKDSFILYKPKDIVAGDFYWMETIGNTTLFAVADCTGHGVPGAMVSVICNNGLNRSVREHQLIIPGEILDKTREIVVNEFEKSEEDVKDGMDIALCSLNEKELKYAGANNPLWIIRKDSSEIEEIKATKQAVGKVYDPVHFSTHTLSLNMGDSIYLFSDGLADQFGGENGKKLKAAQFKKLLLSIKNEPMDTQKIKIDELFENWKGELEQVDDVCVIGVRV